MNNKLILRTPASWWKNKWREALPSGNGTIGAAVYGGVHMETVMLNHENLWHGGAMDPPPDISYTLPQVRKLMDEGRYKEASKLSAEELKRLGYNPVRPCPLPLADLQLTMKVNRGFTGYRRILDMETGEVSVSWEDGGRRFERVLFVSRANDLVVYEIRTSSGTLNAEFAIDMHAPGDSQKPPAKELKDSREVRAEDGYFFYAVRNDDGTDFGAVSRIIATGGQTDAIRSQVSVQGAEKILILTKVFVKGERQADWARLKKELDGVAEGYEALLEAHTALHKPLFQTAEFRLEGGDTGLSNEELLLQAYEGEAPNAVIQNMWAFGRYLFISGTREGGLPFGLYGLWPGDYSAIWSQHVANINVEMIHWHAPAGGLIELTRPLIDYYSGMMEQFKVNARHLFGARGICIPAYTAPGYGYMSPVVPVIVNWTGGAGWLSQHFYAYYQYTGDQELLKERILPFMRESALFYEDFLVLDENGYYRIYPSISPENTPANYTDLNIGQLGHPMPTTINATCDLATVKELLRNLIEGSREAGLYAEDVSRWQAILERIPPYAVNEEGALREWMHPEFKDNYNHRHIAHLYPFFPGNEITEESDRSLYEACAIAVEKRLVVGITDQSGWSFTYLAHLYARMGKGDKALECLDLLSRSDLLNNFYTVHNDWRNMGLSVTHDQAPVQMDANMGWISAVQEMLLYASAHMIKLLPALPAKWSKGAMNGLRFHTGRIDLAWDQEERRLDAKLHAERDTKLTLKLPEAWAGAELQCSQGRISPSPRGADYRELELPAGSTLTIQA